MREITLQFEDDSFKEKLEFVKRNGYGIQDGFIIHTPADEEHIISHWILDMIQYDIDHEVSNDGTN